MPPSVSLEAQSLCFASPQGLLIDDVSSEFLAASFNVVLGRRGRGKDVLLRLLGLLDVPSSGHVVVKGIPSSALDEPSRERLRNQHFGFVFGPPFLLPSMTVLENVAMPLFRISNVDPAQARKRIDELLGFIGLADTAQQSVSRLSAYDQKCISVARGLANDPEVLFVEEYDQNVTAKEACGISALLRRVSKELGTTVIATASSEAPVEAGDRILVFGSGRLLEAAPPPKDPTS